MSRNNQVTLQSIQQTYHRYSSCYDTLFGPALRPGRQMVVKALNLRPGTRILEVGIGTGLSLPLYPRDVRVTGIDISPEMLEVARRRVDQAQLENVDALLEMDAGQLEFDDESFDKVVAMYVMSVVPDPVQVIHEVRRVCKPAGEIFIVNHFHSRLPLIRHLERLMSPLSRLAGFRPDMDLNEFIRDAQLDVLERSRANLFGHSHVLRCNCRPARFPPLAEPYPEVATEF